MGKGESGMISEKSESEVAQSCLTLCDPMDSSLHQDPPSMGFSRQEYWSGLPFPFSYILAMDVNLGKLWEVVRNMEAWHAAVHWGGELDMT